MHGHFSLFCFLNTKHVYRYEEIISYSHTHIIHSPGGVNSCWEVKFGLNRWSRFRLEYSLQDCTSTTSQAGQGEVLKVDILFD